MRGRNVTKGDASTGMIPERRIPLDPRSHPLVSLNEDHSIYGGIGASGATGFGDTSVVRRLIAGGSGNEESMPC